MAPDGGRQVKLLQMKIFLAASQEKDRNLRGVEKSNQCQLTNNTSNILKHLVQQCGCTKVVYLLPLSGWTVAWVALPCKAYLWKTLEVIQAPITGVHYYLVKVIRNLVF